MSFARNANAAAYPANRFDSNAFLNPLPLQHIGGEGHQSAQFLQHSLLTFFSEFDTIITKELKRPTAGRRH
ncbi:MAG: hypothetical protein QE263_03000 [Vampirovibrionales bacterium]|nr:hypothetical protein [Vampirovibrionales bacterium]